MKEKEDLYQETEQVDLVTMQGQLKLKKMVICVRLVIKKKN